MCIISMNLYVEKRKLRPKLLSFFYHLFIGCDGSFNMLKEEYKLKMIKLHKNQFTSVEKIINFFLLGVLSCVFYKEIIIA